MIQLSVIIPTRNRANLLQKALQSIVYQTFDKQKFEVLVIDNGSTDNTKQVVESFATEIPHLHYFYIETPGLHNGRHKGLKEAKADILIYADDDIEAFPTWLEAIYESFRDKDVVLVGGKNLPKFEIEPPFWVYELWKRRYTEGYQLGYLSILDFGNSTKQISPYYVWGCNFSIRKSILYEAKGFHPDGFPQNLVIYRGDGETYIADYVSRNGHKTIYNPNASVLHNVTKERLTIDYFYKRAFNQGVSNSFASLRNKYFEKNIGINKLLENDVVDNQIVIESLSIFKKIYNRITGRDIKSLLDKQNTEIEAIKKQIFQLSDTLHSTNLLKELSYYQKAGYNYHQNEAKNNPEILNWTLKETYLDD